MEKQVDDLGAILEILMAGGKSCLSFLTAMLKWHVKWYFELAEELVLNSLVPIFNPNLGGEVG